MGKILVLYHSGTGNTAKMAAKVAEGAELVPETDVRIRSVEDGTVDDLKWCDGIAVGSPTNFGTISYQMKQWWDTLPGELWGTQDGKISCTFSSAGSWGGGSELTCQALMMVLTNYGFLTFGITDYVGIKFAPHYGSVVAGEPRKPEEINSCLRLGQRLAEWVAVYIDGRAEQHPLKQTYDRFSHLGK